jgi:hypothetical protein
VWTLARRPHRRPTAGGKPQEMCMVSKDPEPSPAGGRQHRGGA